MERLGVCLMGLGILVGVNGAEGQVSVVEVAVGSVHACALTTSGGVKCWGNNSFGELGDGSTVSRPVAGDVPSLTSGVKAISAGGGMTCALTGGGAVKCWGSGLLGDGSRHGTSTLWPVDVVGLTNGVTAIAVHSNHSCAITEGGSVKCWGDNAYGQVGDGTTIYRLTPVDVVGLGAGVIGIAVNSEGGGGHSCAVTTGGGVKCWGGNNWGQVGSGLTAGAIAVTAGDQHSCALTNSGGIRCWGGNYYGQSGDGTTESWRIAASVSAAGKSTCALTTQGGVKCWGWNLWGQLGDGTRTSRPSPGDVSGMTSGVRAVFGGGSDLTASVCAVTIGGGVKCWGHNHGGQLGDGTTIDRYTPVDVIGLSGVVPTSAMVVEYYHGSFDHYFITWMPGEIAKLDAGVEIRGWARTGYSFKTYTTVQAGTSPVCRFYIPPALGDSHFFGRGTVECNDTGRKNPSFVLEDPSFMQMFLPVGGVCPVGTVQVYRVFSNRPDANHRYMTDKTVRDQMVVREWLAEGDGPDLVVMCAPQ